MARSTKDLSEQIERAKRFAAGVTNPADRERFEKIAADYQQELNAAAGLTGDQPSAATETASSETEAATSVAAQSDAVASEAQSAPSSTDDQPKTTS